MSPPKPLNKYCYLTFIGDVCPKCGEINTTNAEEMNNEKN